MKKIIIFFSFFITAQVFGQVVAPSIDFVSAEYAAKLQVLENAEDALEKAKIVQNNAQAAVIENESFLEKALADIEAAKIQQQTAGEQTKILEADLKNLAKDKAQVEADISRQKKAVVTYPNCKTIVITQGEFSACPAGYMQILYSDMVRWKNYDDIRICQKTTVVGENVECFGGYLVHGIAHSNLGDRNVKTTERIFVPKKMHVRIRFSNFFDHHMTITVINETTGQTIHNAGNFTNGQVVELPFSEKQDQVFRFYDSEQGSGRGVMIVYIDHINVDQATREAAEQKERETMPQIMTKIFSAEVTKQNALKTITEANTVVEKAQQTIIAAQNAKKEALVNKEQAEADVKKAEMELEKAQAGN